MCYYFLINGIELKLMNIDCEEVFMYMFCLVEWKDNVIEVLFESLYLIMFEGKLCYIL